MRPGVGWGIFVLGPAKPAAIGRWREKGQPHPYRSEGLYGLPGRGLPDRLVVHLKNEAASRVRRFQLIECTIGLVERKAPGM